MKRTQLAPARLFDEAVDAMTSLMMRPAQVPDLTVIADQLNVDHSTLSKLFRNENQIMLVLAENAMAKLHAQCVRSVVTVDPQDSVAQFEALADAYITWAFDHPREFAIIASKPAEEFVLNEHLTRSETALHELMLKMLRRAQANGQLGSDEDLSMLLVLARTFAYGVARKMLLGDLSRWMNGADGMQIARNALHVFIRRMFG